MTSLWTTLAKWPKQLNLAGAAICYLAFPVILFLMYWLKFYLALPLVLLAGYLTYRFAVGTGESGLRLGKFEAYQIAAMLCVSAAWVGISGIGGAGYQNGDYVKHNSITRDLTVRDIPLTYRTNDEQPQQALVYFVSYYLPGGISGRYIGWRGGLFVAYLWGVFGIFLVMTLFADLIGSRGWLAACFFPLLGGGDVIGHMIYHGGLPAMADHIEWWAGLFQFSSTSAQLFWVPQHALPGWIAGMLCLSFYDEDTLVENIGILAVLAAFWSLFVAIGIFLLMLPRLVMSFRTSISISNVLSVIPLAVQGAYISANDFSIPGSFLYPDSWDKLGRFFWFNLLEYGLFVPALLLIFKERRARMAVAYACLILFALQFYRFGRLNDLPMRASIPILLVLWIYALKGALQHTGWLRYYVVVVLLLFAGAGSTEIYRSLSSYRVFNGPQFQHVRDFQQSEPNLPQYVGSTDAFFFRYLAR